MYLHATWPLITPAMTIYIVRFDGFVCRLSVREGHTVGMAIPYAIFEINGLVDPRAGDLTSRPP